MRKWWILVILSIFYANLQAQFVQIGDGNYAGNFAGPMRTSSINKYYQSKFAYIFPQQVLGNLVHGDSIQSLEFFRLDGADFDTTCRLKIWIANTTRSVFGSKKVHFPTETSNAQLIYSQNPKSHISNSEAFYKLPFIKPFKYDTSKGSNLTLFVEFSQKDTLKGSYSFYFEGSLTVSGYAAQQTQYSVGLTAPDSLTNVTEYHPTIIFNFPRFKNDAHVRGVYSLGKIPLPLGNPDSVKVLIKNVGKEDLVNFPLVTYSKGVNKQLDSFKISLKKGTEQFFKVPSLSPSKQGLDTVYVVAKDVNKTNDTAWSYRLGNENVYSYRDITMSPAPGGIGFNGTQGDFVARFQSNISKFINQVSVVFASSGRTFKIGIWSYDSIRSKPGKLIYQSDSLKTVNGTYILDLKNPVKVKGSFYVGVRQLDLNNIAFGYQDEYPIRPQTFFFAEPLGDTNWIDFNPGAPYKFIIEPRLQADYDLAAISASYPKDSINKYTTDTLAPIGTISNVGVYKPTDSIDVVCEIWGPNLRAYREIIRDTIGSGVKRTYTFPKKFYPKEFGPHKLLIFTKYKNDKIKDNDTATRIFYVGLKQDVMVKTVHDPVQDYLTYEYQKDTLQPLATIMNLGYDNTTNFKVRCKIFKGSKVVYDKINTINLPKFQSSILYWPTLKFADTGRLDLYVITEMTNDVYRLNDTVHRILVVYKKTDFGVDTVRSPKNNVFYNPGTTLPVEVDAFNDGILSLYKVPVFVKIIDPYGQLIYFDSVKPDLDPYSRIKNLMPKKVKCIRKGLYKVLVFTQGIWDIYPKNDTASSYFKVGLPYDFLPTKISIPDTLSIGMGYTVGGTIRNEGFTKGLTTCPVICEVFHKGNRVYYQISNVSLDSGSQTSISYFTKFKPMSVGDYSIRLITNFASDMKHSNDTLYKSFYSDAGNDVLPVDIVSMPPNAKRYFKQGLGVIEYKIQQQGRDSAIGVTSQFNLYYQNTKVNSSSVILDTLSPREVKSKYWSSAYVFNSLGYYRLELITNHPLEQNVFNDTFNADFEVIADKDLLLEYIDSPQINSNFVTKQGMYPRVKVRNIGRDSIIPSTPIVLELFLPVSGTKWYEDTVWTPVLYPADTAILQYSKRLIFAKDGVHRIKAFVKSTIDVFPSNDTLDGTVFVGINATQKVSNVSVKIYPNPASDNIKVESTSKITTISMVDMTGRNIILIQNSNDGNSLSVNLPGILVSGTYLISITTNFGTATLPIFVAK